MPKAHFGSRSFGLIPKLEGWDGPKVNASARIAATAEAPAGDHYVELVRKCIGGRSDIFKIQTIRVTVE